MTRVLELGVIGNGGLDPVAGHGVIFDNAVSEITGNGVHVDFRRKGRWGNVVIEGEGGERREKEGVEEEIEN